MMIMPLAQAVVQLCGDASAFVFLGRDQLARECLLRCLLSCHLLHAAVPKQPERSPTR